MTFPRLSHARSINRGEGLGFVRDDFRALGPVFHLELRISGRFQAVDAPALHEALRDARDTATKMPALHDAREYGQS